MARAVDQGVGLAKEGRIIEIANLYLDRFDRSRPDLGCQAHGRRRSRKVQPGVTAGNFAA
jgi:hypothetical protein